MHGPAVLLTDTLITSEMPLVLPYLALFSFSTFQPAQCAAIYLLRGAETTAACGKLRADNERLQVGTALNLDLNCCFSIEVEIVGGKGEDTLLENKGYGGRTRSIFCLRIIGGAREECGKGADLFLTAA